MNLWLDALSILMSVLLYVAHSPLSVVENAKGKLRQVLDLKYVNSFQSNFKVYGPQFGSPNV